MKISQEENELIDLLYSKGLEKDAVIGIILSLDTTNNIKMMLEKIKNNPNANYEDIFKLLDEIIYK